MERRKIGFTNFDFFCCCQEFWVQQDDSRAKLFRLKRLDVCSQHNHAEHFPLTSHFIVATVRKYDAVQRSNLTDFGKYVAECLPKYVQKVQLTCGDELEVLIAPEGVLPVLQFLKDHHQAQFENLVDIAGLSLHSYQSEANF